jgi:Tol biopolymer transport system component
MLRRLAALSLLAFIGACGDDSGNPFGAGRTRAPSADAVLLFVSASWAAEPDNPRELLALNADGSVLERLTGCATLENPCDFLSAAPSPDRTRVAAIRTEPGAEAGASALYFMDLARSVEQLLFPRARVASVDWSPDGSFLLYTSVDPGGREDLFFSAPNGSDPQNLTGSTDVRERAPRVDPGARTAAFERIDSGGVGRIYIYQATPVTSGEAAGPSLPGTPYVVGADADPAWSPDATSIVFRRLTGVGYGDLGTWDVLTVKADGTGLKTLATGAVYRGAPDWGRTGIVFVETDLARNESQLVVVQADGSGRRVLRTESADFRMGAPRFLPGS